MNWNLDEGYIKKHLESYVKFQLSQGYQLKDVKQALLKYGYDSDLVEGIFSDIDSGKYKPMKRKGLKELDEDLFVYIQNLLVDYIKKEENQGYSIEVIEKALINYGHHPKMVKKAVSAIRHGAVTDIQPVFKFPPGLMFIISLIGIIAFVIFMTFVTEIHIYVAFLSFVPCIAMTLIAFVVIINTTHKKLIQMLPIISVAGVVLIFIGILQISPIARRLSEPGTILIINVFLVFIATSIMSLFSKNNPRKITVEEIIESVEVPSTEIKLPEEPVKKSVNKKERLKLRKV